MELEGLRGLAAIVVVIYHFSIAFYLVMFFGPGVSAPVQHMRLEDNLYASPIAGLMSGTFAVAVFFVLSGFVLSIGFFQTGKIEIVKKLAAKRYVRLMLPALASILICYTLIKLGLSHTQEAAAVTRSSWLAISWNFVPHLFTAIQNGIFGIFVTGSNIYNNVLWTMTSEFSGSFLVFGTLLMFARSRYRWLVYAALLAITFNTWLLGFVIGMVFADLYSRGIIVQKDRNFMTAGVLLLLGLYLGGYPFGTDLGTTAYAIFGKLPFQGVNYQPMCTTLGASLLVFVVLWTAQFASVLRKKRISVIGKYTFSLYLVHLPILYTFTAGIFVYAYRFMGYNKAVLLAVVLSVPVVWGATVLFEKYIDSKSVAFASYCSDIYFGKQELRLKERLIGAKVYVSGKIADAREKLRVENTADNDIDVE
jgi:peptidoglycan/LPS O-acetylase OafA/YrhL